LADLPAHRTGERIENRSSFVRVFQHRLTRIGLASLAVPAVIFATGTAAQAHYEVVHQGYDYAVIYADHFSGAVCDKEADGHYVYAQFVHGVSPVTTITDGGDPGCDYGGWSDDRAREFRVCESVPNAKDYCSPWIYT
jgi:hypothetical protein